MLFRSLEGIANRDSIPYAGTYDLGPIEGLRTVLRGTLRYFQNCMSISTYLPNFNIKISWLFRVDALVQVHRTSRNDLVYRA